jgi:hypothetical protein
VKFRQWFSYFYYKIAANNKPPTCWGCVQLNSVKNIFECAPSDSDILVSEYGGYQNRHTGDLFEYALFVSNNAAYLRNDLHWEIF